MPVTKSAKKALRQSLRKRAHNLFHKKRIKNLIKEIKKLISEKNPQKAKELLPTLYKFLDKAVKENVIKENTANRKKSKITKLIDSALKRSKT